MATLAPSFLIGSILFLQVMRTTIKSRLISKFGQIQPRTAELAVKNPHIPIMEEMLWPL